MLFQLKNDHINIHPSQELFKVVEKYFPQTIIVGESALFYQGFSEYEPEAVELAIPRESTRISGNGLIDVKRISKSKLIGVEVKKINGAELKIFSKERCLFEVAQNGPASERFVKVMNRYFSEEMNLKEIYALSKKLKNGELVRSALLSLQESRNIY